MDSEWVIVPLILAGFAALGGGIVFAERRHVARLRASPVVNAAVVSPLRTGLSALVLVAVVGAFPAAALGLGFGPEYALPVTAITVVLALAGVGAVMVSPWNRVGAIVLDGLRLTSSQQGLPDVVIDLSQPWELVVVRSGEAVSVAVYQGEAAIVFRFVSYEAFEAGSGAIEGPDLGAAGRVLHERLVAALSAA